MQGSERARNAGRRGQASRGLGRWGGFGGVAEDERNLRDVEDDDRISLYGIEGRSLDRDRRAAR